jgi:hypothetical protein
MVMDTNHKQVDTMLRSKHSKVPWNKVYFNGKKVMMYEFVFDICDKTDDLRPFVMATDFNDSGCGIFWIC